ncbi:acyltransferase family protein [Tunturiibacter lichenicola]|uniref:acyltransferase family protein n=1 Tax=Tunturiibacter lichenicola TaxID=2051959 RepID=UPI003D9B5888
MTSTIVPTKASREGRRLQFLDAARGIAAFAVMVQHSFEATVPSYLAWSVHHVNFGAFGVVMFFLVSGFIIPVSIDRAGKLTLFWESRFFRLYPMYWVSLIATLGLGYFKLISLAPQFFSHPITMSLVNVTMFQTFLHVPDALGVYWTLSLELLFYIVCSVLFAAGWLRRSLLWAWMAVGTMACSALTLGLVFHRSLPAGRLGLLVTAFVGTAIYNAYTDQMNKKNLYSLLAGLLLALLISFWFRFQVYPSTAEAEGWNLVGVSVSWVLAYAVFGILLMLRDREFPKWILWIGRISYSLYLVHGLVLFLLPKSLNPVVFAVAVAGLSIAISGLTYEFVEKPAIAFHRDRMKALRSRPEPSLSAR